MKQEDAKVDPDLRGNKVEKIRHHMENTIRNMDEAEAQMEATEDAELRKRLEEENKRREEALIDMRSEVLEELINR